MDIANFRAQLVGDGARPNLFRVTLNLPAGISSSGSFNEKFSILCRAASIPASSLGAAPVAYMGREVQLAGNRTFADWSVTVLNDEDFSIRNTIEDWMAKINSHRTNVRDESFISATSYTSNALVEHLGKSGEDNIIASYNVLALWPKELDAINLAYDQNNQIEEYGITFSMDYWERTTTETGTNT